MLEKQLLVALPVILGFFPQLALAEDAKDGVEPASVEREATVSRGREPLALFSIDDLDTTALSRAHFVTRATFSDGRSLFSGASGWSFEARGHMRLWRGFGLTGTLPLGYISTHEKGDAKAFIGNIALGFTVGTDATSGPGSQLRIGGAFETYLPTSPEPASDQQAIAQSLVAAIRGYEPQLYIPEVLAFRARGHVEYAAESWVAALELGLVPAFTLNPATENLLILSATGRVSKLLVPALETYLEVGGSAQIAGAGEIAPPLLVTPGVRLHLWDVFDPSLFASINFVESNAIIFGVDLATAARPASYVEQRRARNQSGDSTDDFLGGF